MTDRPWDDVLARDAIGAIVADAEAAGNGGARTRGGIDQLAAFAERAGVKMRVQWCHGAPGIVSTVGDLIPEELAIGAGELIWRAEPPRKGPGLCHGAAGNGFGPEPNNGRGLAAR